MMTSRLRSTLASFEREAPEKLQCFVVWERSQALLDELECAVGHLTDGAVVEGNLARGVEVTMSHAKHRAHQTIVRRHACHPVVTMDAVVKERSEERRVGKECRS